jgi:hypothetical protein
MIGFRDAPPPTGSPRPRLCSSTRRDRQPGVLRGIGDMGLTNTSTSPLDRTPSRLKTSLRQRFRDLASFSRPFPRDESRAASQTSSHTAARSTPGKTSSSKPSNNLKAGAMMLQSFSRAVASGSGPNRARRLMWRCYWADVALSSHIENMRPSISAVGRRHHASAV